MANPKKIKAEVKEIISFGRQVYKVTFFSDRKLPRFKAGQFMHLTLDEFDPTSGFWPESRVFSIASCSSDRRQVSIVYSVKGSYTKKMEDILAVGLPVWLKAPYGEFIISNHINNGENAVLIAGGTGISPYIPFLENVPDDIAVKLFYGIRDADLMIFDDVLDSVFVNKNVTVNLYLESGSDKIINEKIDINRGMLSMESILENIEDTEKSKFFISGPPFMIELFKEQLLELDISNESIIIDEWG